MRGHRLCDEVKQDISPGYWMHVERWVRNTQGILIVANQPRHSEITHISPESVIHIVGIRTWYLAKAKALSVGLSNAYFKSLGLPSLIEKC